jgi:DNA (cytosine-5)-methyltransferase 1
VKLLDLFCCAGGAGMGYHRAGFSVVGVDISPQPRYPFEFVQADALTFPLDGFDAIHASPPCQDYSRSLRHMATGYPRLIEQVRDRLTAAGLPWVIENVPGAPLPHQTDLFGAHGVELCGSMFGLHIRRHRLFECSFPVAPPRGCDHSGEIINPYNHKARQRFRAVHGADPRRGAWQAEMGVPWMTDPESSEAVPPAYTEHIGRQLSAAVRNPLGAP